MAYAQRPQGSLTVLVRSARNRESLLADLRGEVAALDPQEPLYDVLAVDEVASASLGQPRFRTVLIGIFGLVALLLAAVGIYGVMAYSVSQRTQEIGIRMALGAASRDVWKLIFGQVGRLLGASVVVGLSGALAISRLLATLLFDVAPTDPATQALVCLLLSGVAALAAYVPARRASRVDPSIALRQE
jgi:putative ABC transport system permease protein